MAQESIRPHFELLVVGGSAGSLEAVLQLLPGLQKETGLAVLLVLHRRGGESLLSQLLGERTSWPVKEAEEKEPVCPGTIYIAPADYHLLVEKDRTLSLDYSEKVHYSRPSIDVTFESAADVYGPALIGVLLSGANADGADGLKKIREAGGFVMVQDPLDAQVPYMPQQAIARVQVHQIAAVAAMPAIIHKLLVR